MNVSTQRTTGNAPIEPSLASSASATTVPSSSSLLPEPGSAGLDGVQDAMSLMYELVAKQGQSTLASGEIGVDASTRQQTANSQKQAVALQKQAADEARANSGGGLFGEIVHVFRSVVDDVASGNIEDAPVDAVSDTVNILDNPNLVAQLEQLAPEVAEYVGVAATVVAAAALTTATAGSAGVVIAAVVVGLSASGMLADKTHCFGDASAYIGLGCDVASAVLSCGASAALVTNGALATASAVTDAASGVSDGLAGASTVVTGQEQAAVLDDTADVSKDTNAINRNTRVVSDIVAGLKATQQSNQNALQVLASAAQTYGHTLTLASAAKA